MKFPDPPDDHEEAGRWWRNGSWTVPGEHRWAKWFADSAAERNERPVGVSHLLAADDALSPGRWGAHITLCGAELRPPSATAVAQDEDSEWSPEDVRYCPECVQEAHRWVSDASPAGEETRWSFRR